MIRFLLLFSCILLVTTVFAQRREADAREDLRYGSRQRSEPATEAGGIWYGASAQLGFAAGNNQSSFRIGLAPMVGYKFNNFLSAGPRVSLVYNSYRNNNFNPDFKDNSFSYSGGLFVRAKVFRGFFVHGEYSLISEKEIFFSSSTGFFSNRITRAIPFLGAGLSQGGGIGAGGFELLLLFRLTQRERLNDAPYEFRTGFNYNF
jgi:hypothetical protein